MNRSRIIMGVALIAGVFLVSVLSLGLILPHIIDSQFTREKVRAFLAEKTNGAVTLEQIAVTWFPRPAVVIRGAGISSEKKEIEGNIQKVRLHPSIRHLLTGRMVVSSVAVEGTAWVVRLPARDAESFDLEVIEAKIRAALKGFVSGFPGMVLRIQGGSVDIRAADGQSIMFTDIDANLGVTAKNLDFRFSGRSDVADRIRFAGEIGTAGLATKARISVDNLRLRKAFHFLSPGRVEFVDGETTLTIELAAMGLKKITAEIDGSLSSLMLVRGKRKALIKAKDFKATVNGDEKVVRLAIERMDLVAPQLNGAGELIFDRSSSLSVKLTGRNLDAQEIREITLGLAGDVELAQDVFRYVRGGKLPVVKFESRGGSFAEMLKIENIVVAGNLRDGRVFVPGPDLHLENVAASVLISDGILAAKDCSAALGKAKGRDGFLRVGLAPVKAPFHLDIMVETDAAELRSLLVRHVKAEAFRKELTRIRHVDGWLSGRVVLGESIDSFSPKFSLARGAVTASYDRIPYPISVRGGRFDYDSGKIEVENFEGAIGRSSFSGLTGFLRNDGQRQITIKSANLQLDLEQTELLLRNFEDIQKKLGPETSARGKIDFVSLSLNGPLDDPSRWDFRSRGKVEKIFVKHALLPAPIAVSQGSFEATHERLTFSNAKMGMLDASMTVGGLLQNWQKPPLYLEATGSGVTGGQALEWLWRQSEWPAEFMLRSPLEFSSGRVVWRDDGDFSFKGRVTVGDGPWLSVDMARNLRSLSIKELTIDDGAPPARATFELDRDRWGFSFRGSLDKRTLDRVFWTSPLQIGLLQGDFEVSAFREHPFRFSARGTLAAKNLVPPVGREDAIIEQMVVEGDKTDLNIRAADLRWRGSHISAAGKLAAAKEALRIDMDVAADRLVWEEFSEFAGGGDGRRDKDEARVSLPPLEGLIRLKTGSFAVGTFYWNPLQVSAELTPSGINGEVQDSVVCGIRTAGRFSAQKNGEIKLDMRLSVRDGELESTSRCLSGEKSNISGAYSLNARLAGGGKREQLARTLVGEFDFVARDGQFVRSAQVDATFDYLNDTGDFKEVFPDLDKEALPYRLVSARGMIERQSLIANEFIIQASPYTITGQGMADLEKKTVDAKGLVTVLLPAEKLIKNIPLIGSIVGSSMVGIPVEVTGSLDRPRVTYLSPAALGTELLNVPVRILKVPFEAMQIFAPTERGSEKK